MKSGHLLSKPVAIGDWKLDPASQRLVRDEQHRALNPKEIAVLDRLARRAPALVTTEELLAGHWPGVVVSDHAVHVVIGRLRKKLGDDARSPKYIETLPKRGYRLIAPVDVGTVTPGPVPPVDLEARASEAVSKAIYEFNRLAVESPEVNRILVEAMTDIRQLSAYDRNRFNALANILFYNLQKAYYVLGIRGEECETWRGQLRSLDVILQNPAFRHRWEELSPFLGVSFRRFVEHELLFDRKPPGRNDSGDGRK